MGVGWSMVGVGAVEGVGGVKREVEAGAATGFTGVGAFNSCLS